MERINDQYFKNRKSILNNLGILLDDVIESSFIKLREENQDPFGDIIINANHQDIILDGDMVRFMPKSLMLEMESTIKNDDDDDASKLQGATAGAIQNIINGFILTGEIGTIIPIHKFDEGLHFSWIKGTKYLDLKDHKEKGWNSSFVHKRVFKKGLFIDVLKHKEGLTTLIVDEQIIIEFYTYSESSELSLLVFSKIGVVSRFNKISDFDIIYVESNIEGSDTVIKKETIKVQEVHILMNPDESLEVDLDEYMKNFS